MAFVAWVPFLLALEGVTFKKAVHLGFVAGLSATLPAFRFLYPVLHAESGFHPALCVLIVVLVAAYHALRSVLIALFCTLDYTLDTAAKRGATAPNSPLPGPPSLLFVAGLVASELAVPSLFPWFFGVSVHSVPFFLQSAELLGPILVSVVLCLASVAVAETVSAWRANRKARPHVMVPSILLPILAAFWGVLRIPQVDSQSNAAPSLQIGVVQPNLVRAPEQVVTTKLRELSVTLAQKGAELLVWPEGALPWILPAPLAASAFEMVRAPEVPVLAGAIVQDVDNSVQSLGSAMAPYRIANSALLFDSGHLLGRYDKHYLLPFSESLPFSTTFPWLREISPHSGNFTPGATFSPLYFRGHALAVFICYEDLFPGHVLALQKNVEVELLVNLTNDSWFLGTDEPQVHLALSKLRAVEQRKFLVRSTLTGRSAVIDPVGRVILVIQENTEGAALSEVHLIQGRTVYGRVGDAPWWFFLAATFLGTLWRRRIHPKGARSVGLERSTFT